MAACRPPPMSMPPRNGLPGVALRTPLVTSPVLDALTGARVFLKAEILQRTGSFKFRGAYNKLSTIPQRSPAGGVVAYSSGNHAQGVAAAASCSACRPSSSCRPMRRVPSASAPPRSAPRSCSMTAARRSRGHRPRHRRRSRGAALVPPYDDALVIAGQGTAGREIVEDLAALELAPDLVLVSASGGGLTAGIALAVKARAPAARLYTAEPRASTIMPARSGAAGASRIRRSAARSATR